MQGKPEPRLLIRGSELVYLHGPDEEWRVAISAIKLIAEWITEDAPADDYFLTFATTRAGEPLFLTAIVPAGADELLEDLGRRLHCSLTLRLMAATRFSSRVMWPEPMAGQPLYVQDRILYEPDVRGLVQRIFGRAKVTYKVSPEVVEYLRRAA